ncbi:MAG: type II toxin-antitoxin system RnlB family antitoxin [Endomicrobiaceae bacterium]|nr:type II toxin-antitoxin system RnlB family antitoxin [Endomicrobiaceae bacterium]
MKKYKIFDLSTEEYQKILICLTYDSILSYLNHIEKEKILKKSQGVLIIDQLLVTGNQNNRFISCEYSMGKLNLSTAKNIKPDISVHKITMNFLRQNLDIVNKSILSKHQKLLLGEGNIF